MDAGDRDEGADGDRPDVDRAGVDGPDAAGPHADGRGWTFRIDSDARRPEPLDPGAVAAAREAGRAMQAALQEADRQSDLLLAAIRRLAEEGATASRICVESGIVERVAGEALDGVRPIVSVCRDLMAQPTQQRPTPSANGPDPADGRA